jgi:hypothetical protein
VKPKPSLEGPVQLSLKWGVATIKKEADCINWNVHKEGRIWVHALLGSVSGSQFPKQMPPIFFSLSSFNFLKSHFAMTPHQYKNNVFSLLSAFYFSHWGQKLDRKTIYMYVKTSILHAFHLRPTSRVVTDE